LWTVNRRSARDSKNKGRDTSRGLSTSAQLSLWPLLRSIPMRFATRCSFGARLTLRTRCAGAGRRGLMIRRAWLPHRLFAARRIRRPAYVRGPCNLRPRCCVLPRRVFVPGSAGFAVRTGRPRYRGSAGSVSAWHLGACVVARARNRIGASSGFRRAIGCSRTTGSDRMFKLRRLGRRCDRRFPMIY